MLMKRTKLFSNYCVALAVSLGLLAGCTGSTGGGNSNDNTTGGNVNDNSSSDNTNDNTDGPVDNSCAGQSATSAPSDIWIETNTEFELTDTSADASVVDEMIFGTGLCEGEGSTSSSFYEIDADSNAVQTCVVMETGDTPTATCAGLTGIDIRIVDSCLTLVSDDVEPDFDLGDMFTNPDVPGNPCPDGQFPAAITTTDGSPICYEIVAGSACAECTQTADSWSTIIRQEITYIIRTTATDVPVTQCDGSSTTASVNDGDTLTLNIEYNQDYSLSPSPEELGFEVSGLIGEP